MIASILTILSFVYIVPLLMIKDHPVGPIRSAIVVIEKLAEMFPMENVVEFVVEKRLFPVMEI